MGYQDWWRQLSAKWLETASQIWGLSNLVHVSSSANAVYRATRQGKTVFLRFCHLEQRDADFLASGIGWARQLGQMGAPVCTPLESVQGNLIECFADWLTVLWSGLEGQVLTDTLSPAQLEAWGQALGQLHLASTKTDLQPVQTSGGLVIPQRFTLRQFWQNISSTVASDPELLAIYRELTAWLEALPENGMLLCHGDFRPANAIWDGHKVSILDFDEPTLAHPEYDIARACLRDDCQPFIGDHLEVFLRGYTRIRPCEPSRVFNFLRLRALLMLAWDMQDSSWGTHFLRVGRELARHGAPVAKPRSY